MNSFIKLIRSKLAANFFVGWSELYNKIMVNGNSADGFDDRVILEDKDGASTTCRIINGHRLVVFDSILDKDGNVLAEHNDSITDAIKALAAISPIKGEDGNDGNDGKDGEDGNDGGPGTPGAPGADGDKGDKGDKGDAGDMHPCTYKLTQYEDYEPIYPGRGEVGIFASAEEGRFWIIIDRYDSRGYDNGADKKFSYINQMTEGSVVSFVDVDSARTYTQPNVKSFSFVVTGMEFDNSDDAAFVYATALDIPEGMTIDNLLNSVYSVSVNSKDTPIALKDHGCFFKSVEVPPDFEEIEDPIDVEIEDGGYFISSGRFFFSKKCYEDSSYTTLRDCPFVFRYANYQDIFSVVSADNTIYREWGMAQIEERNWMFRFITGQTIIDGSPSDFEGHNLKFMNTCQNQDQYLAAFSGVAAFGDGYAYSPSFRYGIASHTNMVLTFPTTQGSKTISLSSWIAYSGIGSKLEIEFVNTISSTLTAVVYSLYLSLENEDNIPVFDCEQGLTYQNDRLTILADTATTRCRHTFIKYENLVVFSKTLYIEVED